MSFRRYNPGSRPLYPLAPNTGGQGTPQASATPYASDIAGGIRATAESFPHTFDYRAITTAPASGETVQLIGDSRNAALAGIYNATLVPMGHVGEVDGIYPYLEGSTGPINGPRIPGAGVVITWSILVNNRPVGDYGTIRDILAPWTSATADRPLLYLFGGEILTCAVTVVDPGGLYSYVGIRIRGRIVSARLTGKGQAYGR